MLMQKNFDVKLRGCEADAEPNTSPSTVTAKLFYVIPQNHGKSEGQKVMINIELQRAKPAGSHVSVWPTGRSSNKQAEINESPFDGTVCNEAQSVA